MVTPVRKGVKPSEGALAMSKWRFWSKEGQIEAREPNREPSPAVATKARGFTPPPPRTATGLAAEFDMSDPDIARRVTQLQRLEHQVEEAELAAQRDNPWNERAALVDQAIKELDAQIRVPVERIDRNPPPLPDWPLTIVELVSESPSRVVIAANEHRFPFAEEIDWAERGTTVVKGDLLLESDELAALARELKLDLDVTEQLQDALFALATEVRDAALDGRALPGIVRFDQLLTTCPVCGDIQLWNGVCLSCVDRKARLARFETERQRLFTERDAILSERANKVEQLPVLRKRYAEAVASLRERS
jgi:hypothetical protein